MGAMGFPIPKARRRERTAAQLAGGNTAGFQVPAHGSCGARLIVVVWFTPVGVEFVGGLHRFRQPALSLLGNKASTSLEIRDERTST